MDWQSESSRTKLHGSRPGPLTVSKSSRKMKKKHTAAGELKQYPSPVVIHVRSPKVFHVRPQEFMSLVQQLTGNSNPPPSSTSSLYSCDHKSHRPESQKDTTDHQMGHIEHFKFNSRVGGPAHALSTDLQASMQFVDFV